MPNSTVNPVRVPDDNRSLHNIGEYIMSYEPYMNAYITALVNRIARVIVMSRVWKDKWAVFEMGKLDYGETVEEIFVNIAKPHSYDPAKAETQVFKREIPDVRAAFHSMNYQKFYKVTISNDQLRQAFLSYYDMNELIARIVDSLYTGMNLDVFLTKKYMLAREAINGGIYTVVTKPISGDGADPDDAITKYRQYTNNLEFLKTLYNRAGVRNSTPIEDQVIIVPNEAEATLGVKVLAAAFNLSEVDYISKRIPVDSFEFDADDEARLAELFANDETYKPFTDEEKKALQLISAVKLAKDWFMCFDNFEQFTENYNGEGVYWQYFFHVWKTFSVSPFANAVLFTSQVSKITEVTVSPNTANVAQGTSVVMTAKVAGTGLFEKTVEWSVKGTMDMAAGTHIDGTSGVLRVASDETVDNVLTVTAMAKDGQTGTAQITVTAAQ
jgi:hypothetical protein|nr:MAG TPA_asm: Head protein [Caudoviricetes sp.]